MTDFHTTSLRAAAVAAVVATFVATAAAPPATLAQTTGGGTDGASQASGMQTEQAPAADTLASPLSEDAATGDFYLRAGVGLDWPGDARFRDESCLDRPPVKALYGCGQYSLGDFGAMAGFELGVGYLAAPFLRVEGAVQLRPNVTFEGRANFLSPDRRQDVSADVTTLSAMLAAYLDLPALGWPRIGPFSPFVGAGAGLTRIDIDETRMDFPKTFTIVPGDERVNLAWMLTAGVASSLQENVTLDLAWRYTDSGTVETGRGRGRVEWRDGSQVNPLPKEPPFEVLGPTRASLTSHGLWASVRYAF